MKILVTGGAGYIGSHVIKELVDRGYSNINVIDKDVDSPNVNAIFTNCLNHQVNILDASDVLRRDWDVIIHLAAYISVEESVREPAKYWVNNLLTTSKILDHVKGAHLIFASTGTAFCPENPYAWSKVACEQQIQQRMESGYTIFRFYNVSGLREGLAPTGEATHLIRRAAMAARGEVPDLKVFGDDWDTVDGTAVRDYIHVRDLAASIVNAIDAGPANTPYECLGSGRGYSVLEVAIAMKKASGVDFQVTMAPRRDGDVASMVCPTQYKHIFLKHTLGDMCLSAFKESQ